MIDRMMQLSCKAHVEKSKHPHGKHHNKTENKTTVSLYLSKNSVEKARKRNLNLSRIMEQALSSILDYIETQNIKPSSESLTEGSLQRETSRAGSSVWHERRIRNAEVGGPNPPRSTKTSLKKFHKELF